MIKKKNVDIGWIIYNSMIDLVTLWIWFPAIIAQLCIKSSVEAERNEEKIKVGLAISSKASSDTPQFGSQNVGVEILEELKEIKDMQKNLVTFMDYQHKWNMFMERKFQANQINIYGVPTHKGFIFARTSKFTGMKKKWRTRRCQGANNNTEKKKKIKSTKESIVQMPHPQLEETTKEEDDAATHLGGVEPLTSHFTIANTCSDEDNWRIKMTIFSSYPLSFLKLLFCWILWFDSKGIV